MTLPELRKTVVQLEPGDVQVGHTLRYRVEIENPADSVALSFTLMDAIEDGLEDPVFLDWGTLPPRTPPVVAPGYDSGERSIYWGVTDIAPSEVWFFEFDGVVSSAATPPEICNQATTELLFPGHTTPRELLSDDPDTPAEGDPTCVEFLDSCRLVLLRNAAYPDESLASIFTQDCPSEPPLDPSTTLDPFGEDCLPGTVDDDTCLCLPSSDAPDPAPPDRPLVLYQVDAAPPVSNPVKVTKAGAVLYFVF